MIRYRHFKGKYRAWFKLGEGQPVHNFSFHNLHPECIEIRNISPLETRETDADRTGDYLYYRILKARKKGISGMLSPGKKSEIVIIGEGDNCFSEDLEHVILKGHSGPAAGNDPAIRSFRHDSSLSEHRFFEGEILFSIPLSEPDPVPAPQTEIVQLPEADSGLVSIPEPEKEITEVPDLVLNSRKNSASPEGLRLPSLSGCLLLYWNLLKWSLFLLLILGLLSWLGGLLRDKTGDELSDNGTGNVEMDPPVLNPGQDTLAPMPWDYLTRHRIRWNDFSESSYLASYATSSSEYQKSLGVHAPFSNPSASDAMQYWNAVYTEFYKTDHLKIDSLVDYFRKQQISKNLNTAGTAEMVITFIQEIPYCLVHEGSCADADKAADFIREYHQSGKDCLPGIIAGVQTPYEFIHNLKGDCDTRSLLGFTILSRLSIPASIWVSEVYGHSVLGVGAGTGSTYYKMANGIRHSAVELTAKGFRLGMLSPEHGDMNNWKIALYKNE